MTERDYTDYRLMSAWLKWAVAHGKFRGGRKYNKYTEEEWRLEVDNLQLRSGALVTEVTLGGLGQTAGLAPGDVIYRVGGVDVADNVMAAARLSLIESDTDTVVNFLRRGRPYRVKLRQE